MHPDIVEIAAYLDGAQPEAQRAELRAHLLTCQRCARRLRRLRQDASRISTLAQAHAPDVRVAVRARLKSSHSIAWPVRSSLAASVLAIMLLFVLVVSAPSGATLGWVSERLFVLSHEQLVELNADNGMQRGAVPVGNSPGAVLYDWRQDRLYVLNQQGIVEIDPQTLRAVNRWQVPQQLRAPLLALDPGGGKLYVAAPRQQVVIQVDTATWATAKEIALTVASDALAIAPDGRSLYAYSRAEAKLEVVDLQSFQTDSYSIAQQGESSRAWLAASLDGQSLYLLTYGTSSSLYRFDLGSMQVAEQTTLSQGQPPWGLVTLGDGRIAVPRGDGQHGGIGIYDPSSLKLAQQIDPSNDQHHLIAGPQDAVFAFTWNGALTRYNISGSTPDWSTTVADGLTDGVFVPAGWRWPFPNPVKE